MTLTITCDWESAPGVRAPELRATWGRLRIMIGDEIVTLVKELESRSQIRESIDATVRRLEDCNITDTLLQENGPRSSQATLMSESSRLSLPRGVSTLTTSATMTRAPCFRRLTRCGIARCLPICRVPCRFVGSVRQTGG